MQQKSKEQSRGPRAESSLVLGLKGGTLAGPRVTVLVLTGDNLGLSFVVAIAGSTEWPSIRD